MKILIAPDSFKHSFTAREICNSLRKGLLQSPGVKDIRLLPMGDGGEGTIEAIFDVAGGQKITIEVHDPLMRKIRAEYLVFENGSTAFIEMANASGIELLREEERDPWLTTTYGTGEFIKDALDRGIRKFIIGVGGSATNDGGMGMARALGARFLNEYGQEVNQGGGNLGKIKEIRLDGFDPRVKHCEMRVACDVENILTGMNGASIAYSKQKGANDLMAEKLDKRMWKFYQLCSDPTHKHIPDTPGAGAAGGLAAGLAVFCQAGLYKGFDLIAEYLGLEEKITEADIVITGEGKVDQQTLQGKVPAGIAKLARKHGRISICIAGMLGKDWEKLYDHGMDLILPIQENPSNLDKALEKTPELLEKTGFRIGKIIELIAR